MSKIIEKLPTPILKPKLGDNLKSVKWGYLIIFDDLNTQLDLSTPSESEKEDAINNFFIKMKEELNNE
jgi:hypothetical protein